MTKYLMNYHPDTPLEVIQVLETRFKMRHIKERVRVYYGDTVTGESWLEEHDVMGYIGRSTGTQKVPLLIRNSAALGGGAILTHCIIAIQLVNSKRFIYKHPTFNVPALTIHANLENDGPRYNVVKIQGNEVQAGFPTHATAQSYINFMYGKRMTLGA